MPSSTPNEPALLTALRGARPASTPVWFMRQAGRSLPEYRAARAGVAMLDACLDPGLAAEITLQPVRRHGVDAAVFFSDIVVPVRQAGVPIDIRPGVGPVLDAPVRTAEDVAALPAPDPDLAAVAEGVRTAVAGLGGVPLLGFAGAPFTLACYLVEGGPSKDHLRTRTLMHADPGTWRALMAWAADVTGAFLRTQVAAGAAAVQLFDSWAGVLSAADYRAHVAPWSQRALSGVGVPVVHFAAQGGELLAELRDVVSGAGAPGAVGIDHRVPLDEASRRLGGGTPVQGNIDPAMLAAPWPVLAEHVRDVLRRGRAAPAHVVNLGHGVPPTTDPDVLTAIVRLVHEEGERA
jgi:uroporphyrinogen decarboxylase